MFASITVLLKFEREYAVAVVSETRLDEEELENLAKTSLGRLITFPCVPDYESL